MTSNPYPGTIDHDASVVARRHLLISAPRAKVWEAHIDVSRWPEWQDDIRTASIDGPVAVGNTITWTTAGIGGAIPSTIYALEPLGRTLWGGPAMGIVGIHEWRFSDAEGGTLVETDESWVGEPIAADSVAMQAVLDASLDAWLGYLSQRVAD